MSPLALLQTVSRSTAEGRFEVGGISFADPWFLLAIPVAIVLLWRGREPRRHASARVPTIGTDDIPVASGPAVRLGWVPAAARIAAAILVLVALARPLEGRIATGRESEGIDIALLLDRSSSMEQRPRPSAPRRFDVVRSVVADFAERRMTDEEGARDNVALFGFAGYADLLVPFTLDVESLKEVLAETDVEREQRLDGTAIGGALAQAVDVLSGSDSESRIAILLTDGEETLHHTKPLDAAKAAAEVGIRVYTVYAGPRTFIEQRPFGRSRRVQSNVGELPKIAELTGGRFFHAENREELESAYAEIEELERTPRVEERFAERYDLYPLVLAPALFLLVGAMIAGVTIARRMP
ncbi:MAG: VWA domain-containing protein [Planctomycetota bacterium]